MALKVFQAIYDLGGKIQQAYLNEDRYGMMKAWFKKLNQASEPGEYYVNRFIMSLIFLAVVLFAYLVKGKKHG